MADLRMSMLFASALAGCTPTYLVGRSDLNHAAALARADRAATVPGRRPDGTALRLRAVSVADCDEDEGLGNGYEARIHPMKGRRTAALVLGVLGAVMLPIAGVIVGVSVHCTGEDCGLGLIAGVPPVLATSLVLGITAAGLAGTSRHGAEAP